ncbi:hypothetical protein HDU78_000413 [Chytriomyces hyalinus]|nr:hypothetical protein HDU78_000413 [Chytriomyces hyalinus]
MSKPGATSAASQDEPNTMASEVSPLITEESALLGPKPVSIREETRQKPSERPREASVHSRKEPSRVATIDLTNQPFKELRPPPQRNHLGKGASLSQASLYGHANHVREISETWTTIVFKMRWCLMAIVINISLIVMAEVVHRKVLVNMDSHTFEMYCGVAVEVIFLLCNEITNWGLDEAAACVFGYLLSSRDGFSPVVCGYLQTGPMAKLGFAQHLSLTSPSRKILTRISFIWILVELLKILTPFVAISIRAESHADYNDFGNCIYFIQDNSLKPYDRGWPTMFTEGGVSEYVFGSSLGIMRSEVAGENLTTAIFPPTLISPLNDGDTIIGMGFSAEIQSKCRCATGVSASAFTRAGIDASQAEQVVDKFKELGSDPGLTFGVTHTNDSVIVSNAFSGYNLCGGYRKVLPLICSTTISNHQSLMVEIEFMTDGTTASIAPNIVNPLYTISSADTETWLSFGMTQLVDGPVSNLLTPPTVPGSLAPILWWTSPNLIGIDRAIVEAGVETMYAILFKAAIQRTYTAMGTSCPRKNSQKSHSSEVIMFTSGYYVTLLILSIQLLISLLSMTAFAFWFMSTTPIGPAVRATQESVYLMTLVSASPSFGGGLYELCNAETYAIWQKLDTRCRIGESVRTLNEEMGKIVVERATLVRPLKNGRGYY